MQSQLKKPACAMPSTMIIMPAMKVMVAQLMPELASSAPAEYQNEGVMKSDSDSDDHMASGLRMQMPKTMTSVSRPQESVTMWRSILSMTMSTNMTRKITKASICATESIIPFLIIMCMGGLVLDINNTVSFEGQYNCLQP